MKIPKQRVVFIYFLPRYVLFNVVQKGPQFGNAKQYFGNLEQHECMTYLKNCGIDSNEQLSRVKPYLMRVRRAKRICLPPLTQNGRVTINWYFDVIGRDAIIAWSRLATNFCFKTLMRNQYGCHFTYVACTCISLTLSQCTLTGPVYTGMRLECIRSRMLWSDLTQWPPNQILSVHWDTTGQTTLEDHWSLVYTGMPLEPHWLMLAPSGVPLAIQC